MGAGTGQARHVLQELRRAGSGSIRLLNEEQWDRLEAYVRWLYRCTDEWGRERSLREALEVFSDIAAGEELEPRRELRRQRADRYYAECGGESLRKDLPAARRLWVLCYQFVMVWERMKNRPNHITETTG